MTKLNIVVFGATGFTGKIVVKQLVKLSKNERFSWGVAGRSQKKLKEVLSSCFTENSHSELEHIETIQADLKDESSIQNMCSKANILINCVGPYRFYGEEVIKHCILTSTHHIDLSGEPEFLETIQLKYNQAAKDKNLLIVGSCGFDSAVADLGVIFTRQNCARNISHVESLLTLNTDGKYSFNYATWQCAVHGFSSIKNLAMIRKQLFKTRLSKSKGMLPKRSNMLGYYYDQFLQKYAVEFLGSDKSVVERTQQMNYDFFKTEAFQYSPYMTVNSLYSVFVVYFYGLMFTTLCKFRFGRYLLLKYYKFFSNGLISQEEEKIENIENVTFNMKFKAYGEDGEKNSGLKNLITAEVNGPDPAYITASRVICHSAVVILNEFDKIPARGVLTPGFAFANTSLIERLNQNGIQFKVLHSVNEDTHGLVKRAEKSHL